MPTVDEDIRAALDDPETLYAALGLVQDAVPFDPPARNIAMLVVSAAVDDLLVARAALAATAQPIAIRFCVTEADLTQATGYTRDELWQHLSLDDWDYALVCDKARWEAASYIDLERWLFGPCSNEVVELARKDGDGTLLVGMAYHA